MKKFILMLIMLVVSIVTFGQDGLEPVKGFFAALEWDTILNVGLGVVSFVFLGGLMVAQDKIRKLGELLVLFADAVEDRKINANEKTDLAKKARELLGKKV